jgi:excisionase family DNA binding protein
VHNTDMENEFLSADEAAELLHMHPRTVRRLLGSGELPGTRLGRQWRISRAAVRVLIEGGAPRKPAASEGPAPDSEGRRSGTNGD